MQKLILSIYLAFLLVEALVTYFMSECTLTCAFILVGILFTIILVCQTNYENDLYSSIDHSKQADQNIKELRKIREIIENYKPLYYYKDIRPKEETKK